MKQYKLIKEYPGSPKLGFEVNFGNSSVTYNRNTYPFTFYLDIISTFNEFWQEIIEKDYEILSYKHGDGTITFMTQINEILKRGCLHEGYSIYQVKRLSDGEIFTIGDVIINDNCKFTIRAFDISDESFGFRVIFADYSLPLNMVKKAKQPLFKTEDGVDIFKGNIYYFLQNNSFYLEDTTAFNISGLNTFGNVKRFSTKKAAEEYILMHKPCLSLNEILDKLQKRYLHSSSSVIPQLKELVKSKL